MKLHSGNWGFEGLFFCIIIIFFNVLVFCLPFCWKLPQCISHILLLINCLTYLTLINQIVCEIFIPPLLKFYLFIEVQINSNLFNKASTFIFPLSWFLPVQYFFCVIFIWKSYITLLISSWCFNIYYFSRSQSS